MFASGHSTTPSFFLDGYWINKKKMRSRQYLVYGLVAAVAATSMASPHHPEPHQTTPHHSKYPFMDLIKLPQTNGAACLDGTPPAYWFVAGAQSDKYYINFEGGGW